MRPHPSQSRASPAPKAPHALHVLANAPQPLRQPPAHRQLPHHGLSPLRHLKSKAFWPGSRACSVLATPLHRHPWQRPHPQQPPKPRDAANPAVTAAMENRVAAVVVVMAAVTVLATETAKVVAMETVMATVKTVAAAASAPRRAAAPVTRKTAHPATQNAARKARPAKAASRVNPANLVKAAMAVTVDEAAATQSLAIWPLA